MGLAAALFVLLLAVTGVLLNHTEELGLDEYHLDTPWLLEWYGISGPELRVAESGNHRLVSDGTRLLLDGREVANAPAGLLHSALATDTLILAGVGNRLLLLTPEGELVDILPLAAHRLAVDKAVHVLVDTGAGVVRLDADFTDWVPASLPEYSQWEQARTADPERNTDLFAHWRGPGLSLERILLDLHSGRIFGRWGVWLMDAAALLMAFLALSGMWIWIDRRRKQYAHKRARRSSRRQRINQGRA